MVTGKVGKNPNKLKILKWFGAFILILFMYGAFSDFGLLAALVLIYILM